MKLNRLLGLGIAVFLVGLAACASPSPAPENTSTPTLTPSPSPSATPTATATATPTPTPTAVPIAIADDLRARRLTTPVPQRGAPCGIVDLLDFPVGPPDGDNYSAPWIFGRFSSRYEGIHAGEDWIYGGGNSLGQPVYAIGHGTVTYAQPLGWGIDQGVVIVRHVFADGRTILSFYGHLDPASVVLKPGDCVKRGDQVGAIGQPRGRPHLHFEIRHQWPDQPGPGYWSVDPTLAGWEPPTVYIWNERMSTSPGVKWTRTFTATDSIGLGLLDNQLFAAYDDHQLLALNPDDGQLNWSYAVTGSLQSAAIDTLGNTIYLSTITGTLYTFDATGAPKWQMDVGQATHPVLMPMPGGGVIVQANEQLMGLSVNADRGWQIPAENTPADWLIDGDRLIFTTSGDQAATYSLNRAGQLIELAPIGGELALSRDRIFVHAPTGIYRIDETTRSAVLLKLLDTGWATDGGIVAAYDGSLIVGHHSLRDRRLIALNPDGTLRWERSVAELGQTVPRLLAIGRHVYAVTSIGDVLLIDQMTGEARRIFDGGSRTFLPGKVWAVELPRSRLVFDFRGGVIVALDPLAAIDVEPEGE
jgi:murein DD-endopeptidase MepM/ murein hydrolase activator NlpD